MVEVSCVTDPCASKEFAALLFTMTDAQMAYWVAYPRFRTAPTSVEEIRYAIDNPDDLVGDDSSIIGRNLADSDTDTEAEVSDDPLGDLEYTGANMDKIDVDKLAYIDHLNRFM
mmetsp:Transcript_1259/g.906  ORF Transcript_1259/g.906 Transcript_1259/m.906 type:complete len:114 (+) Transcript_1259:3012-3353(+)